MIGRFIFECDPDNLIVANKAARALLNRPGERDVMIMQGDGDDEVMMFAKRLKKSIRVQQVKP